MTRSELELACKDACPLCKQGVAAMYRELPGREWTHTKYEGSRITHTICQASALRNSFIDGGSE